MIAVVGLMIHWSVTDWVYSQAFSKKKIEERKQWLTNWMEERNRRAQLSLPEVDIGISVVINDQIKTRIFNALKLGLYKSFDLSRF